MDKIYSFFDRDGVKNVLLKRAKKDNQKLLSKRQLQLVNAGGNGFVPKTFLRLKFS